MVVGFARGLDELVHDVARRAEVGVAHPEVDDVFALAPGLHLDLVHGRENIGRQAVQPRKSVAHAAHLDRKFAGDLAPGTGKNRF